MAKTVTVQGYKRIAFYAMAGVIDPQSWAEKNAKAKDFEARFEARKELNEQLRVTNINGEIQFKGKTPTNPFKLSPMVLCGYQPTDRYVLVGIREDDSLGWIIPVDSMMEHKDGIRILTTTHQDLLVTKKEELVEVAPAEMTWEELTSKVRERRDIEKQRNRLVHAVEAETEVIDSQELSAVEA
jgi:hypothetical protein